MIRFRLTRSVRVLAAVIVGGVAIAVQTLPAGAYPDSVRRACTGDYLTHCSHTQPGSAAVRRCMRGVGPRLSRKCVRALKRAGLVKRGATRRRAAKR